jgi:hypothetical protein
VKITHLYDEENHCFDVSFDTAGTATFFCAAYDFHSSSKISLGYYGPTSFRTPIGKNKTEEYTIDALLFITKEELNTVLEYCANLGFEIKDGGFL